MARWDTETEEGRLLVKGLFSRFAGLYSEASVDFLESLTHSSDAFIAERARDALSRWK